MADYVDTLQRTRPTHKREEPLCMDRTPYNWYQSQWLTIFLKTLLKRQWSWANTEALKGEGKIHSDPITQKDSLCTGARWLLWSMKVFDGVGVVNWLKAQASEVAISGPPKSC